MTLKTRSFYILCKYFKIIFYRIFLSYLKKEFAGDIATNVPERNVRFNGILSALFAVGNFIRKAHHALKYWLSGQKNVYHRIRNFYTHIFVVSVLFLPCVLYPQSLNHPLQHKTFFFHNQDKLVQKEGSGKNQKNKQLSLVLLILGYTILLSLLLGESSGLRFLDYLALGIRIISLFLLSVFLIVSGCVLWN